MPQSKTRIIIGVMALLAVAGCPAANAYLYLGGDEVFDELGLRDSGQDQAQPNRANNNKPSRPASSYTGPSVSTKISPEELRENASTQAALMQSGNQKVQWLGYWVGNLRYRVAQVNGSLYKVSPEGKSFPLAPGTAPDAVAVPFDNAFVKGIMNSQPVAGPETQARLVGQKNGGDAKYISNPGLLTPTFMSTRTMIVNNQPVVVGGPIISELRYLPSSTMAAMPPASVAPALKQRHEQARILPRGKRPKAKPRRPVSH